MPDQDLAVTRHGKYIPPRLQPRYEAALEDPHLLSAREDIALLDARLEDLLRRADTGESGKAWEQLRQHRSDFLTGQRNKDQQMIAGAISGIMATIQSGYGDHQTWADVRDSLMDRQKLVRGEQRRLMDMHHVVTVERLVHFMAALSGIIMRNVGDKETARTILGEINGLMNVQPTNGNGVQ